MKMLPGSFGPIADVFGDLPDDDKLSTGITIGYPILRLKGKVWAITRGGNDPFVLMRKDGDGPRNSIDVVILAASQYVSKVWYESGYVEGATDAPDCFSPNGIIPDASSNKKQSNTCASCPQNKWGSRITPAGKKAKACGDSKRVAVSPLGDIRNEAFGGPMLLRVPAASLGDFGNYGDGMDARGYKYFTIGTKMSFDTGESYPKIIFEPIRPLNRDEGIAVLELRESQAVQSILQETAGDVMEEAVVEAKIKLPASFPEKVEAPVVTPKVTPPPPPPAAKTKAKEENTTPLPPPPSPVRDGAEDGFGSSEPVKAPSTSGTTKPKPVKATVAPPPPVAQQQPPEAATAVADASFEDTLDAQIEELLPEN
jgi:hypothetical protein